MAHEPARVGMPRIVSGVVARPVLSRRLDDPARLRVVRAAAGTGKSTLVASWIASAEPPRDVLWVARSEDVDSRAGFWMSVIAELDRFGVQPASRERVEADARAAVLAAFSALARPMLLVLDNFGPPGASWDEVGRDVVALLAAVSGVSVIVIGREPLWLETREAGAGLVLAGDALRLRADEARRIAAGLGLELSDERLVALLDAADGAVYSFRFAVEAEIHPDRSVAGDAIIARDLRERGDGIAAIPYALSGRDFDLAAELLVTHFVEFDPEAMPDLAALVGGIDPADLKANPGLAVVVALLRGPTVADAAEARSIFAAAVDASRSRRQPGTTPRHRFGLAAGEAIAQRALGRSGPAADAVRDVLAAARDMSHGERAAMGTAYPMLLGQSGLSALYALEPALAHACFNAEFSASPRITFGRRRNVALGHLAMLAVLGGRMRRAERLLGDVVAADWSLERPGAPQSAPHAVALAYVAFNRGDIETGRRALDIFGGDRPPAGENWGFTAVARAVADALEGRAPQGRAALEAADARRRRPGERLGADVAGVEATIELLGLVSSERVTVPAREARLNGRSAILLLTVRALRSALGGRTQTAVELLGRAARFGTSPFQDFIQAIVGVTVALRGGTSLRTPAERIARIVADHALVWPLAILGAEERAAVLAELDGADDPVEGAGALRAALERVAPTIGLTREVVEFHPRELAVLRDLVQSASRTELAARSGVSVNTIKTQLRSLYRKLDVGTREAALVRAAELGLLDGWSTPQRD